jgi:hypothetical protein
MVSIWVGFCFCDYGPKSRIAECRGVLWQSEILVCCTLEPALIDAHSSENFRHSIVPPWAFQRVEAGRRRPMHNNGSKIVRRKSVWYGSGYSWTVTMLRIDWRPRPWVARSDPVNGSLSQFKVHSCRKWKWQKIDSRRSNRTTLLCLYRFVKILQ